MVFGSLSKLVSAPLMRLGVKGGTALLKKLGMKAVKEGAKKLGQKAVMSAASHAAKPATAYVTGKLGKLTDSVLSKVPAPLQPHAAKAIKEMTEKGGDMLALHTPSAMNAAHDMVMKQMANIQAALPPGAMNAVRRNLIQR